MKNKAKNCTNCFISSSVPGISLDHNGVCNICLSVQNRKINYKDFESRMEKVFKEVKKKKNEYDAIVLFSGGVDSSFLVHLLKNKYGLNPLALTIVYPFFDKKSIGYLDQMAETLQVDIYKHEPGEEMFKKYIKYGIEESRKKNIGPQAPCFICSYFKNIVSLNIALEKKIPIVVHGADKNQVLKPGLIIGEEQKISYLKKVFYFRLKIFHKIFGNKYKESVYDINFENFPLDSVPNFIYPLTILKDYSRTKARKILIDIGIKEEAINYMSGGCDALSYFSFVSYKWYGTHVKVYDGANVVRNKIFKNYFLKNEVKNIYDAYIDILKLNNKENYEKYLKIVNEVFLEKDNIEIEPEIRSLLQEQKRFLLKEAKAVKKIEYYKKYFDINLDI